MKNIKKLDWNNLKHEYGVDGQRLLPWKGVSFPFGGAYCIARGKTTTLPHVNEPLDEEEMFIAISGKAVLCIDEKLSDIERGDVVHIPRGTNHYVDNPYEEDFHFYALWWNNDIIKSHTNQS